MIARLPHPHVRSVEAAARVLAAGSSARVHSCAILPAAASACAHVAFGKQPPVESDGVPPHTPPYSWSTKGVRSLLGQPWSRRCSSHVSSEFWKKGSAEAREVATEVATAAATVAVTEAAAKAVAARRWRRREGMAAG